MLDEVIPASDDDEVDDEDVARVAKRPAAQKSIGLLRRKDKDSSEPAPSQEEPPSLARLVRQRAQPKGPAEKSLARPQTAPRPAPQAQARRDCRAESFCMRSCSSKASRAFSNPDFSNLPRSPPRRSPPGAPTRSCRAST